MHAHSALWAIIGVALLTATTASTITNTDNNNNNKSKDNNFEDQISQAQRDYDATSFDKYRSVVVADLLPWQSGITQESTNALMSSTVYLGPGRRARNHHYQIIDHKLYRSEKCYIPSRCEGVEHFLLKLKHRLPNLEFVLNVQDYPQQPSYREAQAPIFSFSKSPQYMDVHYPAWTFWSGGPAIKLYPTGLGRWDLMREILKEAREKWPWDRKEDKGFFRGSRTDRGRDALILMSRKFPDEVDAMYTASGSSRVNDKCVTDGLGPLVDPVPLEDHCRFKYLFNFRGVAASFRFKHLFLCGSLVFHVGEDWTEFFYKDLRPWVHYVPVKADMSDVEEVFAFATNPKNAGAMKKIADAGYEFIREHLEQGDITDYWNTLLAEYYGLIKDWAPKIERRDGTAEVLGTNRYGEVYRDVHREEL